MNIRTLKQLASLRQQIEDSQASIEELTARREQILQEQTDEAKRRCIQAFAEHFSQDADIEVETFEDGAMAHYKTLEISLLPLQDNSPDLLKLRVSGVFDIDTYHEISLAPPDVSSGTPSPRTGGDTEMARLAQRLQELRIEASVLRKEVEHIEQGDLAFVVRGATPKTRDNAGKEHFSSFETYLRTKFVLNGAAG